MDDAVELVIEACRLVSADELCAAARLLEERYPCTLRRCVPNLRRRQGHEIAPMSIPQNRKVSSRTKMSVMQRDQFQCRYTGDRVVHPAALYILSFVLDPIARDGRSHPFGRNKIAHGGHPAFYDLFPAIDHVVPVARGGSHGLDNLVTATWCVNLAKRDLPLDSFENLNLRPLPADPGGWDGLCGWAVQMLERFPEEFEKERNGAHSRDLLAMHPRDVTRTA